jgi:hypothetical protein
VGGGGVDQLGRGGGGGVILVNEYKDLGSWERRVCCTDGKLTEVEKGTLMDIIVYSVDTVIFLNTVYHTRKTVTLFSTLNTYIPVPP